MTVLLVPRGAEERAVRRGAPEATVVGIAAGAAAAVLPERLPPGAIVVLGLCGALRGVRTGDAVVYREVVDERGRFTFDGELVRALHGALPGAIEVAACTVDHVVTRATERAALAAAYSAGVVDMEGTHLARALAAAGRPALMVRVASDDPSYDLPPIEDALGPGGEVRALQLARAFAARPVAAARFVRDVRRALRTLGATALALSRAG
jgi:nucleoside phosphorylase